MTNLPPPDQPAASAAAKAANEARAAAAAQLTDGSLDLPGLFAAVDQEQGKHVLGHMHLRATLMALPHVGDVKANEVLGVVGLDAKRHLDTLGSHERQAVIDAVNAVS